MQDNPKKVLVIIPDGVSLRNFVFSGFSRVAESLGVKVVYWNNAPLDLAKKGFEQVAFDSNPVHPLTQILKYAKIRVELSLNRRRWQDDTYESYYFAPPDRTFRDRLKKRLITFTVRQFDSQKGLLKIRRLIARLERTTRHYRAVRKLLEEQRPDMVFCTNQRHLNTVAPILAARDLRIPTGTFISSWDNLPKATLFLDTDYYFVWSDHMRDELLKYYSHISSARILVTGTPQFEPHFQKDRLVSKDGFFTEHNLDPARRYICYSGDDVTTSPSDAQYLADTALAIRQLNGQGHNLGLIFRRCPVDFSHRYDEVLEKNRDIITALDPKWQKVGEAWSTVLPTDADLDLQMNTIAHSEMVINLGSSMVFDFVTANKPCAFINYDVAGNPVKGWSVKHIYNFVHFRSMPSQKAVLWINSPKEIAQIILTGLQGGEETVGWAKEWFKIINMHPANDASKRMIERFKQIIANA